MSQKLKEFFLKQVLQRNPIYYSMVFAGAFLGEIAIDSGTQAFWDWCNKGVRQLACIAYHRYCVETMERDKKVLRINNAFYCRLLLLLLQVRMINKSSCGDAAMTSLFAYHGARSSLFALSSFSSFQQSA